MGIGRNGREGEGERDRAVGAHLADEEGRVPETLDSVLRRLVERVVGAREGRRMEDDELTTMALLEALAAGLERVDIGPEVSDRRHRVLREAGRRRWFES